MALPIPTLLRALSIVLMMGFAVPMFAQDLIEDVIVERYYVSDANDATDTNGGTLVEGSVTYRVFIDLCEGCSLRAVYGDENHSLSIQSTTPFFNHLDRGRVYGHAISNGALDEGTVALDSWLAIGAASNQKRGVVKEEDTDGSIVGGPNNDGGSAGVAGGLLVNADASALPAVTERDGLVPLASGATALPPNFNVSGDDPEAVFGDQTTAGDFVSSTFRMGCTGVIGATTTNRVLVAQLTTAGELSFCLNVEVQTPDGDVRKFVCSDDVLLPDETASGLLVFPPQCGCTDPGFLEYDPSAGCDDGSCQTAIIFGCLDTTACNFDPNANFNVPQLCCYGPGDCNGLDISLVCSDVGIEEQEASIGVLVGPNPFLADVWVDLSVTSGSSVEFVLYDALGYRVWEEVRIHRSGLRHELSLSDVPTGMYHLFVLAPQGVAFQKLVKQ